MIKNRLFALIFRVVGFAVAVAGILATPGEFIGDVTWGIFMYFTIQTNTLAAVIFAVFGVLTALNLKNGLSGDCGFFPRFMMISVVSLLTVLVSYWLILAPNSILSIWTFANLTTHGVTPALLALDYALFTQPGNIKRQDIALGTIFPLGFVIFTYIAVALGYTYERFDGVIVNFPYFFLDFHTLGIFGVAMYILGILVFVLLVGWILYFIDKWRIRRV